MLFFLWILILLIVVPIIGGLTLWLIYMIAFLKKWLDDIEDTLSRWYGDKGFFFLIYGIGIAVCILFYLFTCVGGNQCSSY